LPCSLAELTSVAAALAGRCIVLVISVRHEDG
jgi:hypothetical protein